MAKGIEKFDDIGEGGIRYLKLKWVSLRLALADNLSTLVNKAFGFALVLVLSLVAVIFLMVALSIWIGEMLGHLSLGFLISGGAFVIAAVTVFLCRRKLIVDSLVRTFTNMFFTSNDDEDGHKGCE